jgi:predicted nicotinamide N-methyase
MAAAGDSHPQQLGRPDEDEVAAGKAAVAAYAAVAAQVQAAVDTDDVEGVAARAAAADYAATAARLDALLADSSSDEDDWLAGRKGGDSASSLADSAPSSCDGDGDPGRPGQGMEAGGDTAAAGEAGEADGASTPEPVAEGPASAAGEAANLRRRLELAEGSNARLAAENAGLRVQLLCADETDHREVEVIDDDDVDGALVLTLEQTFRGGSGRVVWDAGITACRYLASAALRPRMAAGARFLDLGSGTGVVAIAAAALGAAAVATDVAALLPLMRRNIEANRAACTAGGGSVRAAELEWGDVDAGAQVCAEPAGTIEYEYIMAADCVFDDSVDALVKTLAQICRTPRTTVVTVVEHRPYGEANHAAELRFVELLQAAGFRRRAVASEQLGDYASDDIDIHEWHRC